MVVIDGKHLYASGLVKNIEILPRNGPKTTHGWVLRLFRLFIISDTFHDNIMNFLYFFS